MRSHKIKLLLFVIIAIIAAVSVDATLYEYYNTNDDSYISAYGVNWQGQTFTVATNNHYLTSIRLRLYKVGTPTENLTIAIRNTTAGLPTGSNLCSTTKNASALSTDTAGVWYNISFSSTCVLTVGTVNAIITYQSGGDASNLVAWRSDITSPSYAGGQRVSSANSGATWTADSAKDSMFELYGLRYFKLYATDGLGNTLTSFQAEIHSQGNYSTTNGSITTTITVGSSTLYNITFNRTSYVNSTYENVSVSSNYYKTAVMYGYASVYLRFYNEETGSLISSPIDVSIGSDTYSYSTSTSNGTLYLYPAIPNNYTITYNSSLYQTKFYYLALSATSFYEINLYFTSATTTQVTFNVMDSVGLSVPSAYVKLLRHVSGSSNYTMVTMGRTDTNGNTVLPVVLTSQIYKIVVEYGGVVVKSVSETPIYSTTIQLYVDLNAINLNDYRFIDQLSALLTVVNSSNTLNATFTFSDATNTIDGACSAIYDEEFALVNQTCVSSTSGSIKTIEYLPSGKYHIRGIVEFLNQRYVISSQTIDIQQDISMQDKDSFFLFGLLLVTIAIIGFVISPSIGFVIAGFGFVVLSLASILPFNIGVPFSLLMFVMSFIVYKAKGGQG